MLRARLHFGFVLCAASICAQTFGLSPVRALLQENRLEDAIPLCRQFEVLSTYDADNFLACAWVYFRTDRTESAEKLMEQHKKKFGGPEFMLLTAYGKMKRKQMDEARQIVSQIAAEKKGSAYAVSAQELNGEIYELNGQLDTAAFVYKQVVGDDPTRGRAHWGLGRYYLSRNDPRRAVYHLETTAKLWPKHKASRFNLGVYYLNQDQLPEAAKWLGDCYRLDKGDAEVIEQLGVLFEKKQMLAEAIRHWQRALELKKDTVVAKEKLNKYVIQVIDTLIEAKQYGPALAQLEAASKSVTDVAKVQLRRGVVLRNLGRFDKALGDLLAYSNSNPNDPLALRELGICYTNMKLMDQAGNYFLKAAALEPDNGMNHAWMAFVHEAKGDLPKARDSWLRAMELLKDPAELEKASRKLAAIQKKVGKRESEEK